jgi:hypothetical protein
MCHKYERPASFGGVMPISIVAAINILSAYGGTERDLQKVQKIEDGLLPAIRESVNKKD